MPPRAHLKGDFQTIGAPQDVLRCLEILAGAADLFGELRRQLLDPGIIRGASGLAFSANRICQGGPRRKRCNGTAAPPQGDAVRLRQLLADP